MNLEQHKKFNDRLQRQLKKDLISGPYAHTKGF